jgi:uracil-DNA glycosylase family 4
VPRPVLSKPQPAPIMLVGQAPGLTEYDSGLPFQGPAGAEIRTLFYACGVQPDEFDDIVYQTSAVKCFPGRKLNNGRWEDRQPNSGMLRSCAAFLREQVEVVDPLIIVCLGLVGAKAIDGLRGLSNRKMGDLLGTIEEWGRRKVIYLTHTSGTNRLLNSEENKLRQADGQRQFRHALEMLRNSGHLIRKA